MPYRRWSDAGSIGQDVPVLAGCGPRTAKLGPAASPFVTVPIQFDQFVADAPTGELAAGSSAGYDRPQIR